MSIFKLKYTVIRWWKYPQIGITDLNIKCKGRYAYCAWTINSINLFKY